MQCGVCDFRAAIGFCNECKTMVCELCSVKCKLCGKLVCRDHRMKTKKGDSVCISCLAKRSSERAERRARDQAEEAEAVRDIEMLSFESLNEEMDDESSALARERARRLQKRGGRREKDLGPRVLAESHPSRTPIWVTTLWGTGGSLGLLFALRVVYHHAYIQPQIPYLCYLTMFVSIGTVIWGAYGLLLKKGIGMGRKRWFCVIGVVISLIVAVVAWLAIP